MPIMNKDGSVYRLRGPNPLMKEQTRWDFDSIVVHNFSWKNIVIADTNTSPEPVQILPEPSPVVVETPVIVEPPAPPPQVITPVVEKEQPVIQPKVIMPTPAPKNIVRIHCLPGTIKTYHDQLYDEEHKTLSYGEKFEFDANVIDRTDLMLALWTVNKKVTPGSIVYPQTGHARWWRVEGTETSGIGLKILCTLSNEQPSF